MIWTADLGMPGEFKSDRSGIETAMVGVMRHPSSEFKSDRCGIETRYALIVRPFRNVFKSDRCGIETLELMEAV